METALLNFVFDITSLLNTHVTKNFGKDPLQSVIPYLSPRWAIRILDSFISIVTDIKGGSIKMARVLCGINITSTQFLDIFL